MKRALTLILALTVAWTIAVIAEPSDFPVVVSGIQVQGNVEIQKNNIRKAIPFRVGDEIEAEDLKRASQAIFNLGWFSEVMPEIDEQGVVTFSVVENPVLKRIVVTGNEHKEDISVFGLTLLTVRIMPSDRVTRILRNNDVKKGSVLNTDSLNEGLEEVLKAYEDKGYTLIMLGSVRPGETLEIQLVEGTISENAIAGLNTVPESVAREMIDIPLAQCVKTLAIQRVIRRFQSWVYFVDVELTPQQGPTTDTVVLLWDIKERKLVDEEVAFQEIQVEGNTVFPAGIVASTLGKIPEGPIDNYQLLQIVQNLYDLYYRNGYVMVRFSVQAIEDGVLKLLVEEGKIGQITVQGNDRTEEPVIRRNLDIAKGSILNRGRLTVAYQNLMSLGYFKSVDMLPEWENGTVSLSVSIVENDKLGGINGSLAYSPESGGLVGQLDYSQKNLLGTGQDLSFSYSRGLVGEMNAVWNLGYSTVSFFPDFNRVGFDLYRESEQEEEDSESEITLGGRLSFSYPFADYTDLDIAYKHEETQKGDNGLWEPIESLTLAFQFDDVDNPLFPTKGNRRRISLEKAGGFARGAEFAKLDLNWIAFAPVRIELPFFAERDQVLAVRLSSGWGMSLPSSQEYNLGGPMTIRGAEGASVSKLCYANTEYRLAVVEGLTATAFFDTGVDLGNLTVAAAKSSFGLELGIQVAGMYLRLDMAWVLGGEMSLVPQFDFAFGPLF